MQKNLGKGSKKLYRFVATFVDGYTSSVASKQTAKNIRTIFCVHFVEKADRCSMMKMTETMQLCSRKLMITTQILEKHLLLGVDEA